MDMDLLDRIKKLLALGQSSNPHEAAEALNRANALLARHNLTMDQVEGLGAEKDQMDEGEAVAQGTRLDLWRRSLGTIMGKHCGVYAFTSRGRQLRDGRVQPLVRILAIGKPSNIGAFKAMYRFAEMEFRRLSLRDCKGKGRSYAHAWLMGAVAGLEATLNELRRGNAEDQAGLVSLDRAQAEAEAFAKTLFKPKVSTSRPKVNPTAYWQGDAAGRSLNFGGGEVQGARPTLGMGA